MTKQLEELQKQKRAIEAQIDEECRRMAREANEQALQRPSKWSDMTPAQQNYCHFMAFDPDNPDVPLD